ncbi:ABC transporter substrate-binding protein, partial [Symbiobacterium thermophilum]
WNLVGALLCLALLAGCGGRGSGAGGSGGSAAQGPIKVGGIFDITGATGDVGKPHADGARAWFDYLNNELGGVNGR